ncbi:MAG: peptide MFS transporter [Flavobacteriales bacterium]|nr:peptide MFS transporter [Flavobacteriales bacterium]
MMIQTDIKNQEFLGHPIGLFVLFFTEMWERFSYYGMRALLVLFLVSSTGLGGWEWTNEEALKLFGIYTSLVYVTPTIGGILADKFLGYRNAIGIGALIMTLGHACMALETTFFFYAGIACLIIGNGFFKPNIASLVGNLYYNAPEKKDGGYSIFYMGVNAGAFLGILFCGYIGEKIGWSLGFGLAGIFMFFGLIQFWLARNLFYKYDIDFSKKKEENNILKPLDKESKKIQKDRIIVIGILAIFTVFFWFAFEQAGGSMTIFAKDFTQRTLTGTNATIFIVTNILITVVPLLIITWVLFQLFKRLFHKYPFSNIALGFSFLIIWGIVVWMIQKDLNTKSYEIELINSNEIVKINTDDNLEINQIIRVVDVNGKGKYLYLDAEKAKTVKQGISAKISKIEDDFVEIPASWFIALNSIFIILFAPLFSKIWESKFNPSVPVKFGIALILLGLGFGILSYGASQIPSGMKTASVSLFFLVFAYLLHTLGELAISPVGLSYVSKLAPKNLLGFLFGFWHLAIALGLYLAGFTGSYIDKISEKYSLGVFFLIFTIIPIVAGFILFALNKFIIKKMHGIK